MIAKLRGARYNPYPVSKPTCREKKLRVGVLAPLGYTGIGGIIAQFIEFCQSFQKNGHRVILFLPAERGNKPVIDSSLYSELHTLKFLPIPGLYQLSLSLYTVYYFLRNRKNIRLDVFQLFGLDLGILFVLPVLSHVPISVRIPELDLRISGEVDVNTKEKIRRLVVLFYNLTMLKSARMIVCPSNFLLRDASRMFKISPTRLKVIRNFIPQVFYVKRKRSIEEKETTLIYAGRLTERKGLNLLLNAFERIAKEYPTTKLILVGEGPLLENAVKISKDKLKGKLEVVGRQSLEGVRDFMSVSDIFVLPSYTEGLSNALLQAMASGLAVVASDAPANHEIILDKFNGLIFRRGDEEDLYKTIRLLLNDANLMKHIRNNAKKTINEDFSSDDIYKQYYRSFVKLLD